MASPLLRRLVRIARSALPTSRRPDPPRRATPKRATDRATDKDAPDRYPGDHTGPLTPVYAPDLDGSPDPGEIVWAWVPFEEDHSRGKDRPVLLVGRDGPWLLGLMLSSRDHDERPGRPGEDWLDLGAGDWDARRRPSEVRLDRVVRVVPGSVRREGAVLDRARFGQVTAALAR